MLSSLAIMEIQIKTMRFCYMWQRMVKINKTFNIKQQRFPYTVIQWGNELVQPVWKTGIIFSIEYMNNLWPGTSSDYTHTQNNLHMCTLLRTLFVIYPKWKPKYSLPYCA